MITLFQYFGSKDCTDEQMSNAEDLLRKVNRLIAAFEAATGKRIGNDPDTGTQISGAKGGCGDGGFRCADSTTGKPGSQHRNANAVDIYDLGNHLDFWLTRNILIAHGLYREAPPFTDGWCHLQQVAPRSGNRSFIP